MNPSVSIIIPVYNIESYIKECLDSILDQTFTDYELIIVDDCSTDNTRNIIESYIPKFNGKLTILKTEENTGGCGIPRNIGLKVAKGKYVYFMDGDDYIKKTALEVFYNIAVEYNADLVRTLYFDEIQKDGKVVKIRSYEFKSDRRVLGDVCIEDGSTVLKKFILYYSFSPVWVKFIKKEILDNNNIIFQNVISQDVLWTVELFNNIQKSVSLPISLYYYNKRADSIQNIYNSGKDNILRWTKTLLTFLSYLFELKKKVNLLNDPIYLDILVSRIYYRCLSKIKYSFSNDQISDKDFNMILLELFKKDDEMLSLLITSFFSNLETSKNILKSTILPSIYKANKQANESHYYNN